MKKQDLLSLDYSHLVFSTRSKAYKDLGISYLGSVNSSSKIQKGEKINLDTYILYLAPAKLSGVDVCPFRTPECTSACLHTSGRNRMVSSGLSAIDISRIKKTRLWITNPEFFTRLLVAEISHHRYQSIFRGTDFAVRLNGTSDISPERFRQQRSDGVWMNVLEIFSDYDVQFYDYTKDPSRLQLMRKYTNYHITFSYSGHNVLESRLALDAGANLAVVFAPDLPQYFMDRPVIDGDQTDARFTDPAGSVVGLRLKRVRHKIQTEGNPFIVWTGD